MPAVTATAPRTAQVDLNLSVTHAAPRRRCDAADACEHSEATAPRRNPLVSAMMQALSGLMPQAAPATAQDSAVSPARAGEAAHSGELKDAAMAFAHELFNALRTLGGERADPGHDGDAGRGDRGRAHGHHHHAHRRGYGDLAQRLEQLAGRVQTPAAAATPGSASGLSMTASLTTASFTTTSDAATGSTSTAVNLSTLSLSLQQQTAAANAPAESPLLGAFRKLFDALQSAAAPGTARPDAASGLASFLRQLATSLRAGRDEAVTAAPTQGSLISVAA